MWIERCWQGDWVEEEEDDAELRCSALLQIAVFSRVRLDLVAPRADVWELRTAL